MTIIRVENVNLPTQWAHGLQIAKTTEAFCWAGFKDVRVILPKRPNAHQPSDLFAYYHIEPLFSVTKVPTLNLFPLVPAFLEKYAFYLDRVRFTQKLKKVMAQQSCADAWYTREVYIANALAALQNHPPVVLELHTNPNLSAHQWVRLSKHVCCFVAISQGLKDFLVSKGISSERILVAHDGFDEHEYKTLLEKSAARMRLGLPLEETILVYTGQLFPWKGWDRLMPHLDKIPANTKLFIVGGDVEDMKRLEPLLPAAAQGKVQFMGQKTHTEILMWLAAADAGILPTSAGYEIGRSFTSPLKLFEYMAAGLPVIASDVPSSHEVLDESCAQFFTADDGVSFIEAIRAFSKLSRQENEARSIAVRQKSVGFTWRVRGELVYTFLKKVLNKPE